MEKKNRKQRDFRWLVITVALGLVAAVVSYLATYEYQVDIGQKQAAPPLQPVSVEQVSAGPETATVSAYATIRPRWSAELRAAVSGRVEKVQPTALSGERVAKDAVLLRIEDSRYVSNLVAAELAVEQAGLALRKAIIKTDVARKEYEHAGSEPLNDLALHLPEQKIARSELQAAEARVVVAGKDLEHTIVRAPFSGFVTERRVSPGQMVNVGDPLLTLADDRVFELTVELGEHDWRLLKQPLAGLAAQVLAQDGSPIGSARIRQGGGFLDGKTRQHKIFLELKSSVKQPVLAGSFVQVVLPGRTIARTLNIPAGAITQNGYIWFLDQENRLQRLMPQLLFRLQQRAVIAVPEGSENWRIVTTPLASFLPGQQVQPQVVVGD